MANIKAADVAKLRKMTGAGMMDCKKALAETNGDFDAAADYLRKKGQKIAAKRADRDATEGAVIAKISTDGKYGIISVLNCETDFVAKNENFVKFAHAIADIAVASKPANLEVLKAAKFENYTIADEVINQTGVIGEKVELSFFASVSGEKVVGYIHPGNKLASVVAFNQADVDTQVAKDVAMQIAAMNPIAIDQKDVSEEVIAKELEIGKELAINEGKPAEMAEKIAKGRLNKFFKENTLNNQQYVKDNKKTIKQYMQESNKDLAVVAFKRFTLNV